MTDTNFGELQEHRESEGWHLKKEVNLSIIISVVLIGVSCVAGYYDLKKESELNKAETQRLAETLKSEVLSLNMRDSRLEIYTKETFSETRAYMTRMEAKLDRLIERRN